MSARAPAAIFERPAVFLVNGLGDQIMALPAMRALSTIFPKGMQLLLGEGMYAFFYHGLPFSEPARLWWQDITRWQIDVERSLPSIRPCDLFLSVSSWATPSVKELASRMGATWSVGCSEMFDDHLPVDETSHFIDQLFAVPQLFNASLRIEDFSHPPTFSNAAERAAERFIAKHATNGTRVLFFHPETSMDKMWPLESFSWVLDKFLEARPEYKILIAALSHYPIDFERHRDRIVPLKVHLELALAIMRHTDLYLGIDSCFLHAADLFRMPGIGLFGPTNPREWGFRFSSGARSLWARGPIEGLPPEFVLQALLESAGSVDERSR